MTGDVVVRGVYGRCDAFPLCGGQTIRGIVADALRERHKGPVRGVRDAVRNGPGGVNRMRQAAG